MSVLAKSALAACLSAALLMTACDKGSGPSEESPKSLLVGKDWEGKTHTIAPGMEVGNGEPLLTDWFEITPACNHDDIYRFEQNGRYSVDAGTSRCSYQEATGPIEKGRWTLNAEGTALTLKGDYAMEAVVWTVEELGGERFRATFAYPIHLNGKAQTETVIFTVR